MMTKQQTKHKARYLGMQHMTPSEGRPTPTSLPRGLSLEERTEHGTAGVKKPASSVWSVPWDKTASNAIIWLTDPNPSGMLKNSPVSHRIQSPISLSSFEMIPWMEMNHSLCSGSSLENFPVCLILG